MKEIYHFLLINKPLALNLSVNNFQLYLSPLLRPHQVE